MNPDKLIVLAHRIAAFFRPYADEEAEAGIADHLQAFWTNGMRNDLLARIDTDPTGLDPRVVRAMTRLPRADSPIRKETAGPQEVGELGSDAG